MKPSPINVSALVAMLCSLAFGFRASAQSSLHVEVFRMSMEDWNRVPLELRDDHRKLFEKCRTAAGGGRIERIHRSGGAVEIAARSAFENSIGFTYATAFDANRSILIPKSMETRNAGSSLECEVTSRDFRIAYDITTLAGWQPMLGEGARDDIKRSELPIVDTIRINGSSVRTEVEGCRLIGVVPVPAAGGKPVQLALAFALANGAITAPEPGPSGIQVETLMLRGPKGGGNGNPAAHIQSLLARNGSIETDIAVSNITGQKAVAESVTEWIHPMAATRSGEVLVPKMMEQVNQGTTLEVECDSEEAGGYALRLHLEHDFRKPLLPIATGKGNTLTSPEKPTFYRVVVNENIRLAAGAWAAVKEVPLAPILGEIDPQAKDQSCYVFARTAAHGRH